jgi:long-chain acyl-CoA synthetase
MIANNRSEWAVVACAAYTLNAVLVPMYEAQLPSDWAYILNDAECKVVFCAHATLHHTLQTQVLAHTPGVHHVVALDGPATESYTYEHLLQTVAQAATAVTTAPPTPSDLANLIYTSGTTGKPKGVELTHANFTSNVQAAARSMQNVFELIRPDDVSLAFLPWAHSYGQTCELWVGLAHGGRLGIGRGVSHILDDLQLVQPTVLYAVPTLYKKIYEGVHTLMANEPSPVKRYLMQTALKLGQLKSQQGLGMLQNVQFKLLNQIVLSKIRQRFGGKLRHGFVAGAACPVEVLHFMDAIGIPVCEGYGLTETSPIICINTPNNRQAGSVGRAIGGVTVHVVDENNQAVPPGQEGEICCTGPNVMRGYYKNPEATAQVLTPAPDGNGVMFHTGDLGRQDANGWIKITGRLKEQYKLENGKYVVPTPIEEAMGLSRFISQVVLAGANRPYNVALIVPEWTTIRALWKVPESTSDDELAADARFAPLIDAEIQASCAHLKKYEVPAAWAVVAPFTAANNMLTPKMSIRRHKVISTYVDTIDSLYGHDQLVSPAADATGAKEVDMEDNVTAEQHRKAA